MKYAFLGGRAWTPLLLTTVLAFFAQLGSAHTVAQVPPSEADTGSIEAGQFRLRYRIEGAGAPAIVIGSSIYYPRAFSQNLRKHLRLVFLDHRGFAPSPGPVENSEFELDKLLDDVERARRALGLGRIVVIGHSGHAFMALEYAKKYPENVSHVVMIGIAPDLSAASDEATEQYWRDSVSPERKAVLEENLRRLPDEELAKLPPDQQFIKSYVRDGPRIWYDPRFDSSPLWEGVELNIDMMNYVWGTVFRDIDITEGLDTFDRPVFLALGRYDFLVAPPSSWNPIRSKFQNLTVRVFERSGHTPQYEEATLFDEELLRWLSRHP
jgi:proline iminopeptidase